VLETAIQQKKTKVALPAMESLVSEQMANLISNQVLKHGLSRPVKAAANLGKIALKTSTKTPVTPANETSLKKTSRKATGPSKIGFRQERT
ncbi:MAG: hypothetical protein WCO71_11340, partial [Pseudomonadota bacterium]